MKKLNDTELLQCKFVSDLFEFSAKKRDCSSKVFIKAYAYSSISKQIASNSFVINSLDFVGAYESIKKEKNLTRGKEVYPLFVMAWIGYILKYFECATNIPISAIYKKIKPDELYSLYEAYHSLDNELVIKRLMESKNINSNLNNAELMKSINRL